jgi:hypothetical protein
MVELAVGDFRLCSLIFGLSFIEGALDVAKEVQVIVFDSESPWRWSLMVLLRGVDV